MFAFLLVWMVIDNFRLYSNCKEIEAISMNKVFVFFICPVIAENNDDKTVIF